MERRRLDKTVVPEGYTLLEVLLVSTLLVLVGAAGITCLDNCRDYTLLRLAAQVFTGELNKARSVSIACGVPVEIRLSDDQKSFNLGLRHSDSGFSGFALPGSLRFSSSPSKPVIFYNSGTCAPSGSYVIKGKNGSVKVIVSIMGRVRWEFI